MSGLVEFVCVNCRLVFEVEAMEVQHLKNRYCPECDVIFKEPSVMLEHLESVFKEVNSD